MKFTDIIVENSSITEAKLYTPAKKAYSNPDTGITIQNKSAYHVIKDCALITINYLPLWAFGNYNDPFVELNGKFERKDIEEFVSSVEKYVMTKQLLAVILDKVVEPPIENKVTNYNDSDFMDPYGDYGFVQEEKDLQIIHNSSNTVDYLCKLFGVK